MSNTISNSDDVIDSRDVIARIDELRDELRTVCDEQHGDQGATNSEFKEWLAKTGAEDNAGEDYYGDVTELAELEALAAEAEGCGDWQYGETLIRDSYFQDYAQQLADDIGAINAEASWPNNCIDWERAARELRMDYTSVEFAGVTYWLRS